METSGLNHVILTVSDAERARAFYGGLLGFDAQVMQAGAGGSFYFVAGSVWIFVVASSRPEPNDRFNEFRIGFRFVSEQNVASVFAQQAGEERNFFVENKTEEKQCPRSMIR